MAAIIDFQTGSRIASASVPALRVVQGGRSAKAPAGGFCRRSTMKVYRRRRLMVAAALIGVLMVVWLLASTFVGGGRGFVSPSLDSASVHVVQAGETLWSIASGAQPQRDPRHTIDQIVALNGGTDALDPRQPIAVGQEILIPLS